MSELPAYGDELSFLKQHVTVIELLRGDQRVALVPAYQGRVMTSTTGGDAGPSFGWVNHEQVKRGVEEDPAKKIHVFGGEDRFWIGPEGGQFAIYFKPNAPFDYENWFVPPGIDTQPYDVAEHTQDTATFTASLVFTNHSGHQRKLDVKRTVRLVEPDQNAEERDSGLESVAFETDNVITNTGPDAWTRDTGMLSIWNIGMFHPAAATTIVIPYRPDAPGDIVNDSYFGKIPPQRLTTDDGRIYYRGDGNQRGKLGLTPQRATGLLGAYDASNRVLTLVTYTTHDTLDYVNSMWEQQAEPFLGDVINSYNDGPPPTGGKPLGPFFELETSSPAAALKPGQSMRHVHRTVHYTGDIEAIDRVARHRLGASLDRITAALPL